MIWLVEPNLVLVVVCWPSLLLLLLLLHSCWPMQLPPFKGPEVATLQLANSFDVCWWIVVGCNTSDHSHHTRCLVSVTFLVVQHDGTATCMACTRNIKSCFALGAYMCECSFEPAAELRGYTTVEDSLRVFFRGIVYITHEHKQTNKPILVYSCIIA